MKRPTIPELEAALAAATAKADRLRQQATAADQRAGGILGDDMAVVSGIRRKPNARADARRYDAYSKASELWLAWKAADKERDTLEWQLDQAHRDAKAPRDIDSLRPGSLVRTDLGWHRVVRVNRVSVSVATGYSWTDTVRLDRIIETRTGTA